MKLLTTLIEMFNAFWNGEDQTTPEEYAAFIESLKAEKQPKTETKQPDFLAPLTFVRGL